MDWKKITANFRWLIHDYNNFSSKILQFKLLQNNSVLPLFIFNWRSDAVHVMWFITLPSIFNIFDEILLTHPPQTHQQLMCSQNNISWMQVCIFTAIILCSCKTQDHISVGCLRTYLQHINHSALFWLYWHQWFSFFRSVTDINCS